MFRSSRREPLRRPLFRLRSIVCRALSAAVLAACQRLRPAYCAVGGTPQPRRHERRERRRGKGRDQEGRPDQRRPDRRRRCATERRPIAELAAAREHGRQGGEHLGRHSPRAADLEQESHCHAEQDLDPQLGGDRYQETAEEEGGRGRDRGHREADPHPGTGSGGSCCGGREAGAALERLRDAALARAPEAIGAGHLVQAAVEPRAQAPDRRAPTGIRPALGPNHDGSTKFWASQLQIRKFPPSCSIPPRE